MDAGMDAVSDDRAKLSAAGVDHASGDRTTVRPTVVTQVGSDRTGAEVHLFAEDGVAEVG